MPVDDLEQNWDDLGRRDPMWAILTSPDKRKNRWDEDEFFATGRVVVTEVMAGLDSLGILVPRGRALDFGCGIGRLTQALAGEFDAVVGVDVAASMVERARELNRHGERCTYVCNSEDDLAIFPDASFDFILTELVLQHLPSDLMFRYVREFVRVLRPGGVAVFDVPRSLAWSARAIALRVLPSSVVRSLRRRAYGSVMELHTTSRDEVLAFLQGVDVDVLEDRPATGFDPGINRHRYSVRKRSSG